MYLPSNPRGTMSTKFSMAVEVVDVISCDKFFADRYKGRRFCVYMNLVWTVPFTIVAASLLDHCYKDSL